MKWENFFTSSYEFEQPAWDFALRYNYLINQVCQIVWRYTKKGNELRY